MYIDRIPRYVIYTHTAYAHIYFAIYIYKYVHSTTCSTLNSVPVATFSAASYMKVHLVCYIYIHIQRIHIYIIQYIYIQTCF